MEQEMVDAKQLIYDTGDTVKEPKSKSVVSEEGKLASDNENVDSFDSKTKSKEPNVNGNVAELSKPEAIKGEVVKGVSRENSVEGENRVKNAIGGKVSEEVSEEMPNCAENVSVEESELGNGVASNVRREKIRVPTDIAGNVIQTRSKKAVLDEVLQCADEEMADADPDKADKHVVKEQKDAIVTSTDEAATPNSRVRYPTSKAVDYSGQTIKTTYTPVTVPLTAEDDDDDGTPEEQAAFMMGLQSFYKERGSDFKTPKFYQKPLNCLKLWRSVIKLGGYEIVTSCKLWRQVGESFNPPKTCTTISWTFRIFYEKSLLEYEKYKIQCGELRLPATLGGSCVAVDKEILAPVNNHQGFESGRARRDAAARAMQGWHSQRNGRVSEPVAKDKNLNGTPNGKKNFRSIGSLKQKRPNELEISNKVIRTEISEQLVASVIDVGPPADWVKVNVRPTSDCFEVYALVPGLLREEVRVQSDPAGRLVITGQPGEIDNPWGVTPFKKVVSLPARIDPLNTSAVVSLHGGLFVRVPYEQQP